METVWKFTSAEKRADAARELRNPVNLTWPYKAEGELELRVNAPPERVGLVEGMLKRIDPDVERLE